MTDSKPRSAKIKDKLILLGIAVLIVAPVAAFFALQREVPLVAESADDLDLYASDETLIVTRGLKDEDMHALERFENLQNLELHYSELTDAGVSEIAKHPGLKRLVLSSRIATDASFSKLAALTELEELVLLGCLEVTTDGLTWVGDLQNLHTLTMYQCTLVDDRFAEVLQGCPKLAHVSLENSLTLTNESCFALAKIKTLTYVNLDMSVKIGHDGVVALAGLPNLESLHLHGADSLTDATLVELQRAKKLKLLHLPLKTEFSPGALETLRKTLSECKVIYKDNYEH